MKKSPCSKQQRPLRRLALALVLALLATSGCSKGKGSSPEATAAADKAQGAATYALEVRAPEPVARGEAAKAVVEVTPQGNYKINLEFPLKLSVNGPAGASPQSLELRKPQAAKVSEQELRLEPSFTLDQAGEHAFQGTLRFSVCTKEQCEIKTEKVSWTAKVR